MAILARKYKNSFDFGLLGCQDLNFIEPSHTVQRWRYFCWHNCNSKFATMLFGKYGRYDLCSSNWILFLDQIFKILNWKSTYQGSRGYKGTQSVQNKVQNPVFEHPKLTKAASKSTKKLAKKIQTRIWAAFGCVDWALILCWKQLDQWLQGQNWP